MIAKIVTTFLFGLAFCISATSAINCRTRATGNGECISIYDCPTHVKLLRKSVISPADRTFLLESQCSNGVGRAPYVCCSDVIKRSPASGKGIQLPTLAQCGREATGDKIYNGLETTIDEYPWMALLEYASRKGGKTAECGGSLINNRYVLTAAHCVTGEIERAVGKLVTVRLGEFDTTTNPDCIKGFCADPYQEVGVEEVIPHPQYNDNSRHKHHDIALVRLDRDVDYTEFIKPVCLPSMVQLRQSQPGDDLMVVGWGRTLKVRQSPKKLKLPLPVFDHNSCKQKYFEAKNVEITDSQLCAGGKFTEDSCNGDSGGPLMKFVRAKWVIEGIVSYGNKCGLLGWPGVYTRVANYENWIRSSLRP